MGQSVFPPAASGPTLSEITSGVTSAGNTANWNATTSWNYIGAFSGYGAGSITYSGITGYKKIRMIIVGLESSNGTGAYDVRIRLNGDTDTNNYHYSNGNPTATWNATDTYNDSISYIPLYSFLPGNGYGLGKRSNATAVFEIDNANDNAPIKAWKLEQRGMMGTGSQNAWDYVGYFRTSGQPITSITVLASSGSLNSVSAPRGIFLYGAN